MEKLSCEFESESQKVQSHGDGIDFGRFEDSDCATKIWRYPEGLKLSLEVPAGYYQLPDEFRCPVSGDPVVVASGQKMEKSADELELESQKLVQSIEGENDFGLQDSENDTKIPWYLEGMKLSLEVPASDQLPYEFRCPLSGNVMNDPVVVASGGQGSSYAASTSTGGGGLTTGSSTSPSLTPFSPSDTVKFTDIIKKEAAPQQAPEATTKEYDGPLYKLALNYVPTYRFLRWLTIAWLYQGVLFFVHGWWTYEPENQGEENQGGENQGDNQRVREYHQDYANGMDRIDEAMPDNWLVAVFRLVGHRLHEWLTNGQHMRRWSLGQYFALIIRKHSIENRRLCVALRGLRNTENESGIWNYATTAQIEAALGHEVCLHVFEDILGRALLVSVFILYDVNENRIEHIHNTQRLQVSRMRRVLGQGPNVQSVSFPAHELIYF